MIRKSFIFPMGFGYAMSALQAFERAEGLEEYRNTSTEIEGGIIHIDSNHEAAFEKFLRDNNYDFSIQEG